MIRNVFPLRRTAYAAALAIVVPAQAIAADASPWQQRAHSAVRLIAASAAQEGGATVLRAGLEINLEAGWKTYWRYPGDSGVPPRISFARSENVQDVAMLWPAPVRFADGGGNAIGYAKHVVFPLRVRASAAGKPVVLRVDMDYGVCEKLCVPVDAKVELAIGAGPTAHDAALRASEASVPGKASLGGGKPLGIVAVRRQAGTPFAKIVVDVAAEPGAAVDLFAEGPTADWALPLPQPADGAPAGMRRFAFDLDGLPPGANASGAVLRLTATAGAHAVEVFAPLD